MTENSAETLEKCRCRGCDYCSPAGGPCSRDATEEQERLCRMCHDRAANQFFDTAVKPESASLETETLPPTVLHTPYHKVLLQSARRWIAESEFNVAIIVSQMAREVLTEQIFDTIMQKKNVTWLKEPIDDLLPNYNIGNYKVRKLYVALTEDSIQEQSFWSDFKQHIKLRNDVVHSARRATKEEAERSLTSVSAVVGHLETIAQEL